MTRTMIGEDYAGAQCVKITKGTYDPITTLDSDRDKFLYNSKWADDVKIQSAKVPPLNTTAGPVYLPSSGSWTYWHLYANSVQQEIYRGSYFGSLIYDYPLHEIKYLEGGRYTQARVSTSNFGYNQTTKQWSQKRVAGAGWVDPAAEYHYANQTIAPGQTSIMSGSGPNPIVVWRLPGDSTAIENGTPLSPVPGQPSLLIGPTALKVAKPGFNVNTATGTQLAFDSSNIPAKIIAAVDIAIPAGASSFNTGYPLPDNTVVDLHFYQSGQPIYYPAPLLFDDFGAEYWVDGSLIRFNNTNGACRARMLVIAQDTTAPSSGTNDVLRQFMSGSENVVQFLRPGAGSSPTFADVVIDSRWPAIQIIKQGYIAVASGIQAYPITYDASGMFVFIKYCTVHGAGAYFNTADFNKAVRQPSMNGWSIYRDSGGWTTPVAGGDCTYVQYTNTAATFHTFRDQPVYATYDNASNFNTDTRNYAYEQGRIVGLRYYVFGIAIP